MIEMQSNSSLKGFLKDCIRTIKASNPHMSSSQLAKKFSMTIPTFNRIENGDTERPNFNNVIKIIREAHPESRVQEFIGEHYPEMYETYAKAYPGNENAQFVSLEAEGFFKDITTFEIMMLVTSKNGTTKDFILEQFGKKGLTILQKMIDKGLISENNGRFALCDKVNASQETVQNLLLNLIESSYDLETFGTQQNWLSLQYETVNKERAIPKIREILVRANNEIRAVFSDPQNDGSDLLWVGLVSDKLIKAKSEFNGELQ